MRHSEEEPGMNIEEAFWLQIYPLYHLKQASVIRYTKDVDQHYRLDEQPSKDTGFGAELLDGMDEMKASALMFIRFHAIETLLTVLLGSHPHGPVPDSPRNSSARNSVKQCNPWLVKRYPPHSGFAVLMTTINGSRPISGAVWEPKMS